MIFRHDIGLLRAIAVCFVLFYHYHIPFFEGGYIGVDVFFVISGFLMTKIILADVKEDRFSYCSFLERRLKRILPALLGVSAVMLALLPILYFDVDMKLNAKYIALSLAFVSNLYYATLSGDYFSPDAQDNLFLHSWSLSVEWQFYMLYPLVLLLFKKIFLNHFKLFRLLIMGGAMISLMVWLYLGNQSSWSFYLMPTRAWEFLLGALAYLYRHEMHRSFHRFLTPITLTSLLLLLVSAIFIDALQFWSSFAIIIPVLATMVLLALGHQLPWFQNRGLQFLGQISYSLYLWHWPVYVLYQKFEFFMPSRFSLLIPFFLSFILAILSYEFIERKRSVWGVKALVVVGGMVAACAVLFFVLPKYRFWNKVRLVDDRFVNYFQQDEHRHLNPCNCYITRSVRYDVYDKHTCLKIDPKKENILLMGDSHAAQLSTAFRQALRRDQHLLEMSLSLTFPFPEPKGYDKSVRLWRYFYTDFLPKNEAAIDKVFISVHWLMNTYSEMSYTPQEIEKGLKQMLTIFDRFGLDYYFIGQTEQYQIPYRHIALKKMFNLSLDDQVYAVRSAEKVNAFLKRIIPEQHYIDVYQHAAIKHNSMEMNMPYMFDRHHLSPFGASQLVGYLSRKGYL